MPESSDQIGWSDVVRLDRSTSVKLPLFSSLVPAGFASPATDHIEKVCSLDDLCQTHIETTYLVRCTGDSMVDDGLWDGDIMIVDRTPRSSYEGQIVVAWVNGELTVKRFHQADELIVLLPANPAFLPIYVQPEPIDAFKIFGLVTYWLKKSRPKFVD